MSKKFIENKGIIFVITALFFLAVLFNVFLSVRLIDFSDALMAEKIKSNANSLKLYLEDSLFNIKTTAETIALNPDVKKAIKEQDKDELLRILLIDEVEYRIYFLTITDRNGIVLARLHDPEISGDSIRNQQNIKNALNGAISSYFEEGTVVKVSGRVGVPVYDDDNSVIGVVSAGFRLDTKEAAEDIKKLLGTDVSVFLNNTSIASTVVRDGKSVVGTVLEPRISETVISGKQEYYGNAELLGDKYKTFYLPLINANDEAFGAIVIGTPMARMKAETNIAIIQIAVLLLAGLILLTVLLIKNRKEKQRLKKETAEALAESNAKSEFLANMSHEMRTPMNAIIGMTNIGMASAYIERMLDCFKKIDDSSKHLLGIINDILDISKIEKHELELTLTEFVFERTIQRIITVYRHLIEEKNINFSFHIDSRMPYALIGDDHRLGQVISHILSNALKFTPENGSVNIDALFVGEEDEICTVQITIKDTGIGISPEQQANLFQLFHQAEYGRSRKYGGVGLGLALSKRILEMMGGEIYIESEFGSGTAVIFTFKGKRAVAEKQQTQTEGSKKEEVTFAGRRILLVEDIEINREVLIALLEPSLLEIDCAENGKEAFDIFSSGPDKYDLIFMDIQMPVMDGIEAARRIRALDIPKAKTVPIIAVTANAYEDDIKNCLDAGMNAHIGKPVDIEIILECLKKYIK